MGNCCSDQKYKKNVELQVEDTKLQTKPPLQAIKKDKVNPIEVQKKQQKPNTHSSENKQVLQQDKSQPIIKNQNLQSSQNKQVLQQYKPQPIVKKQNPPKKKFTVQNINFSTSTRQYFIPHELTKNVNKDISCCPCCNKTFNLQAIPMMCCKQNQHLICQLCFAKRSKSNIFICFSCGKPVLENQVENAIFAHYVDKTGIYFSSFLVKKCFLSFYWFCCFYRYFQGIMAFIRGNSQKYFKDTVKLKVAKKKIKKIQTLQIFTNLKVLILSMNNITKIENLNTFTQLKYLDLSHNSIEKIEQLNFLSKLQRIDLSYNRIAVVQNIDFLMNLKKLNLACNQIRIFDYFQNMKNLVELNLQGNPLGVKQMEKIIQHEWFHLQTLGIKISLESAEKEQSKQMFSIYMKAFPILNKLVLRRIGDETKMRCFEDFCKEVNQKVEIEWF